MPPPVKSYGVWYGVISLAETCLPAKWLASYRGQELYSGSHTEPGNQHYDDKGGAQFLEPYIRGWVNYYGKFRLWEMNPIFQLLRRRLVMWARKRYKRYKTSINRAYDWLKRVKGQFPGLFYHWRLRFS